MDDILSNLNELIGVVVAVLVALQAIVVYFLSPEKAEKFNWISKTLNVLSKTKAGISPKVGTNDKISNSN